MCNGSRDDVGRAAHFFSKTSSHPASSTLHSGFRPLNGASIVVLHPFGLYRNLVYSTTFIPPLKVQENHSSQIKGNKQKVARFRATITEQFKNKKSEYPEGYSDGARGGSRTRTPLRALAPEASESTNSTTRANGEVERLFCSVQVLCYHTKERVSSLFCGILSFSFFAVLAAGGRA